MRFAPPPLVVPIVALALASVSACTGVGLLVEPSPHERYRDMLRRAGIDGTALGQDWLRAGDGALVNAVATATPFQETGYFPPAKATAIAYRMELSRGRRLSLEVTFDSSEPARLFVDLFELRAGEPPRRVRSLEPDAAVLEHEIDRDAAYVVRIQPELLRGGRFTIVQRTLASLPFPVEGVTARTVQSLFGDTRDAGARAHEGIDIFAPRGTPVLAVSDGVARPDTNPLGGNVVWLRDADSRRTYYYAHLDRWAIDGSSRVRAGHVLGHVGNTGNARGTSPHLHFGIYQGDAINPLPFLQPDDPPPAPLATDGARLGELGRVSVARAALRAGPGASEVERALVQRNTVIRLLAATGGWRRVSLPNELIGYLPASAIGTVDPPLRVLRMESPLALREGPRESAPVVDTVDRNVRLDILGGFDGYDLLRTPDGVTGWANVTASRTTGAAR